MALLLEGGVKTGVKFARLLWMAAVKDLATCSLDEWPLSIDEDGGDVELKLLSASDPPLC